MPSQRQFRNSLSRIISGVATAALALPIVFVLAAVLTQSAQAQTFKVIHDFSGEADGAQPGGLMIDASGNMYGTTLGGGTGGCGTVFRLKYSGSGWVLTPLYRFAGGSDGANPWGSVAIAADGSLYGTTRAGGQGNCSGGGCGTIFHLIPPNVAFKSGRNPWNETVLYRFTGGNDGAYPQGDLTLDHSGNIYGTATNGGRGDGYGVVYELSPSGGRWIETVLYSPQTRIEGIYPLGGVIFDGSGNLYGEAEAGGPDDVGTVYELSPSGSGWTAQILHGFGYFDGAVPEGGLIIDSSGNLYGTTGSTQSVTFELKPATGGWIFNLLSHFYGDGGPAGKMVMDTAGNLYGTTSYDGGYGEGAVFKLTPLDGGWTYTSLHDFTCGSDGCLPSSDVVFDAAGNLYGTAIFGGAYAQGVVWEITP
jgi:uncharacterized repeat protein (TIGR03803 family)